MHIYIYIYIYSSHSLSRQRARARKTKSLYVPIQRIDSLDTHTTRFPSSRRFQESNPLWYLNNQHSVRWDWILMCMESFNRPKALQSESRWNLRQSIVSDVLRVWLRERVTTSRPETIHREQISLVCFSEQMKSRRVRDFLRLILTLCDSHRLTHIYSLESMLLSSETPVEDGVQTVHSDAWWDSR